MAPVTDAFSDVPSRGLVERLASGERRALEECYALYGRRLRYYLATLVGPNDAEDVLQEVFADLWRAAARLDPARPLEAWLMTVSRRRAIDHLRRRRPLAELDAQDERAAQGDPDFADRYGRVEVIRRALASLPSEQRQAIELSYFKDLSQREIARQLGIPLGTVKARMFRGLRQLGIRLREEAWP